MSVKFVNDSTALLSMRDSDFDAYSAYGEVIDNSIQAKSEWSKIKLVRESHSIPNRKKKYIRIKEIAFGDNGAGMSPEVLHSCLQLGYSSRYNDRSGIGRFGVGMTLSAINQCKRIEVYSRLSGGSWYWTYIDLDEITSNPPDMEFIPEPIIKEPPAQYLSCVCKDNGTLVVWKKYDRQPASADDMIEEMHVWLGRTYRKFIWRNYKIFVEEQEIKAIDPLYVSTEMTQFPEDPKAEEFPSIDIKWHIPDIDRTAKALEESTIKIRMSILPEVFRMNKGDGNSPAARKRHIQLNEGISIVRNDREVFYGPIPYFKPKHEEIDRWWGCEISFDAVLDRAFTVKNIKRGALPCVELKETIEDKIKATRKSVAEKVRDLWKKNEYLEHLNIQAEGDTINTGHEDAERIARITPTDKSEIDRNKKIEEEVPKAVDSIGAEIIKNNKDQWILKFNSQPFTIIDERWKGPHFFETVHMGGKDLIRYNLDHQFFSQLNNLILELETHEDLSDELKPYYKQLKNLIDLLIISYSKAEAKFDPETTFKAEDFVDLLRQNWGQYLRSYLNTWRAGNEELNGKK